MKTSNNLLYLSLFMLIFAATIAAADDFVRVSGTNFMVNGKPFYYSGANNYYLRYGDYGCLGYDANGGCAKEALDDAQKMNITVIRTWGFADGYYYWGSLQPYAGQYDETNFRKFDLLLKEASDRGIRLIIPLVNNWNDYGGMCQYVSWCNISGTCADKSIGGTHDQFYTSSCTKDLYKGYVSYVLNRQNYYTGVRYKEDPTIFAWELANEPRAKNDITGQVLDAWVAEMSAYIKSIDTNHLVSTGSEGLYLNFTTHRYYNDKDFGWMYNGSEGEDFIRNHNHSTIDFAGFHNYPDHWGASQADSIMWLQDHVNLSHNILNKPVIMGEYGMVGPSKDQYMQDWFTQANSNNLDGSNVWLIIDYRYPWEPDYGIGYPENASTVSVLMSGVNLMRQKSSALSPANHAPQISNIAPITVTEGANVEISVSATDADSDSIFLSISDGARFDKNGTKFVWKTYDGDNGTYTFSVIASDGILETRKDVSVTVQDALSCLTPTNGLAITTNSVLCSGTYDLPNGITVGSNVALDCNGAILTGTNRQNDGIGLGGSNIIIKNCMISGYSKGISVLNGNNISLINNRFANLLGTTSNHQGVNIRDSKNIIAVNNTFTANYDIGFYAYHSSKITVKNSNLTNNGKGLYFDGSSLSNVSDNIFYANYAGAIYLLYISNNNTFMSNQMTHNGDAWGQAGGFKLSQSSNNKLIGNSITHGYSGVIMEDSGNNLLTGNVIASNTYNFGVDGSELRHFTHQVDTSNTINGLQIQYLLNRKDVTIASAAGFLAAVNSTNITFSGQSMTNNMQAAVLAYCTRCSVRNLVSNQTYSGIMLESCSSSNIEQNSVTAQSFAAVSIEYSDYTSMSGNTLTAPSNPLIMRSSRYSSLSANTMYATDSQLLYLEGSSVSEYNHTITTTNTINGKPIYYYFNANGIDVANLDASVVILAGCRNVNVRNGTVLRYGNVRLVYSNYSSVSGFRMPSMGQIRIYFAYNNTIAGNMLSDYSYGTAIYQQYSGGSKILQNNISGYNIGISISERGYNNISGNKISMISDTGIDLYTSRADRVSDNSVFNATTGMHLLQADAVLTGNNLYSNKGHNLVVDVYNVSAEDNYWGTTDCKLIDDNITDCRDWNGTYGCVNKAKILDSPYPSGKSVVCGAQSLECGSSTNMDFCNKCYLNGGRVKPGEAGCWCDQTKIYINAWFGSCPQYNCTATTPESYNWLFYNYNKTCRNVNNAGWQWTYCMSCNGIGCPGLTPPYSVDYPTGTTYKAEANEYNCTAAGWQMAVKAKSMPVQGAAVTDLLPLCDASVKCETSIKDAAGATMWCRDFGEGYRWYTLADAKVYYVPGKLTYCNGIEYIYSDAKIWRKCSDALPCNSYVTAQGKNYWCRNFDESGWRWTACAKCNGLGCSTQSTSVNYPVGTAARCYQSSLVCSADGWKTV